MTVGIRIKGSAGQVQIDDTMPMYVVREQGSFTGANLQPPTAIPPTANNAAFYSRHVVNFAQVYTTQEPPLVFMKFTITTAAIHMDCFQVEGSPGNWYGFSAGLGDLYSNQVIARQCAGDYFVCSPAPGGSGARIGVRVRNRNTNEVIWDSGWRLVKFLQQTANFAGEGRLIHETLRYSVGHPSGAYFLANCMTGSLGRGGSNVYYTLVVATSSAYPGKLLIYTYANDNDAAIPYQTYMWTVLFALLGQ